MRKNLCDRLNTILSKYGYTVIPTEDLEELKNSVESLMDYIKINEKEEEK